MGVNIFSDGGAGSRAVERVEAVALLGRHPLKSLDAARKCPQFQDFDGGRLPDHERHATGEREQHVGIESIGLGALQEGAGEVADGLRVGHHELDALGSVQGQRGLEAVDAASLQAHAGSPAALLDPAHQQPMPRGVVGERVSLPLEAGGLEGHHEFLATHVDTDQTL